MMGKLVRLAVVPMVSLLVGCTLSIDEKSVFVPRKVDVKASDVAAMRIDQQDSLGGTVSHALLRIGDIQVATTHVVPDGVAADAPLIVACMGNASDRIRNGGGYARKIMPHGEVLLFDYPGYGDSTGIPTAAHLQAVRAPLLAHAEALASERPILLWGHSLGGFVCAQMAGASDAIAGIVLETTAASADEVAASWKPWYLPFLNIKVEEGLAEFETPKALASFEAPVLVIGAGRDTTLSVTLHRSLQAQLKAQGNNLTYLEYPDAGHYDAPLQSGFAAESAAFFAAVRGARTVGTRRP